MASLLVRDGPTLSVRISRSVLADIDFLALSAEMFKQCGEDFLRIFLALGGHGMGPFAAAKDPIDVV
jgi:hypothetical protein